MADLISEVVQLREQGLTDNLISNELMRRGFEEDEVNQAIAQADSTAAPVMPSVGSNFIGGPSFSPMAPRSSMSSAGAGSDITGRIEEITEGLIDEKWDELLKEVKKIVDWKERVEEKQKKMDSELTKLKEDFSSLHQGVLGKLETYDDRMRDVGTELKAVSKVFKDVVPEFVENVKELSHLAAKRKKEGQS